MQSEGAVFFVNRSSGPGNGNGTSWNQAFGTVQAALDAATNGDQIWVARGTYNERITLKSGVELYGGFKGGERALNGRDWREHDTVLDGQREGTVVTVQRSASTS